jgi:hypothetical protein
MGLLDFVPKVDLGTGILIGVGLLAAPIVVPVLAAAIRPALKATIKGGILAYEKSREMLSEACEAVEDFTAEIKAELSEEPAAPVE